MDEVFLRHKGTRAVITGGTQGLGLAVARRLAVEGAPQIVISGRNAEKGARAAAEISRLGTDCRFVQADVARIADCRDLMAKAIAAFGYVNALCNSAAAVSRGTLLETTPELWDEHFNTNARGPMLTMQAMVANLLDKKQPGSIVNILSMAAYCGQPFLAPYSASKAALMTLTRNVANAYVGNRIRCNGITTGWMDTPGEHQTQKHFHAMPEDWLKDAEANQPMGQLVKPDQLASLISYMLSPESGVMTGSIVDYDQVVRGAYPSSGR
jgi:NAD(P)-dependent dehydrogenase (short-subunit alcohol dehydrogenase family)